MKPADRQKMCSNCEGRIPFDAAVCPYCHINQAEKLLNDSLSQPPTFKQASSQDALASLYPPPYSSQRGASLPKEELVRKSEGFKEAVPAAKAASVAMSSEEEEDIKSGFWPLFTMSLGSIMGTIGLLQFFFSENGVLRLEWSAEYWFIYCLAAIPLIYFGLRKLKDLK
jgi:hypothetical protein